MPVDTRFRLLLLCILTSVYLLIYTNTPDSIDGNALLAVASTIVHQGSPDMNVLAYSDWLLSPPTGKAGVDGAVYSKKGLTPSLALIPFVVAADGLPWLSIRATAMFLNLVVTTATAIGLYTLVRWLGYAAKTAFVGALIFGLTTFALVYVQSLYGETLAGLLLLIAVMGVQRYRDQPRLIYPLVVSLALGLLAGVNITYLAFIPVIGVFLFLRRTVKPSLQHLAVFCAVALALLGLLALVNWARFGSPLNSGYHFEQGEGFTNPMLSGFYGLFISPYRGFFWYNPILFLIFPGWLLLYRRSVWLASLIVTLIVLQAMAFAGWWSWHGGVVWGPRFLLPVTPLAVLCLIPLVEQMWTHQRLRIGFVTLAVLSAGMQFLGATYNPGIYMNIYYNHYFASGNLQGLVTGLSDQVLFDPAISPIIGQIALLHLGWSLNPAWLSEGIDAIHFLAAVSVFGAGLVISAAKWSARIGILLVIGVVLIALNLVGARQQKGTDFEETRAVEQTLQPPGTVLVASDLFGNSLMDVEGSNRIITMIAPSDPDDPEAVSLWNYALSRKNPYFWFVTWFGQADPLNWQERQLWQTSAFVLERPVANHRAVLFNLTPDPDTSCVAGWSFSPIKLDRYGVQITSDGLRLTLWWSADQVLDFTYSWFIHLLDDAGAVVTQQDRQPQGGYTPTNSWRPNHPVVDRLFFPVPTGTDVSGWSLRIGFVEPSSQHRLPVEVLEGIQTGDGYALLPLQTALTCQTG